MSLSSEFLLFSLIFCCWLDVYALGIFHLQGRKHLHVSNLWQCTVWSSGCAELTAQGHSSSAATEHNKLSPELPSLSLNQIKQGFKVNPCCNVLPSRIKAVIVYLSKTGQQTWWLRHDQPCPPLSPSPGAHSPAAAYQVSSCQAGHHLQS